MAQRVWLIEGRLQDNGEWSLVKRNDNLVACADQLEADGEIAGFLQMKFADCVFDFRAVPYVREEESGG